MFNIFKKKKKLLDCHFELGMNLATKRAEINPLGENIGEKFWKLYKKFSDIEQSEQSPALSFLSYITDENTFIIFNFEDKIHWDQTKLKFAWALIPYGELLNW